MNIKINKEKNNPLLDAYDNNDLDKFRSLIADGANVNCIDTMGNSLISAVVRNPDTGDNREFFNILMENNTHLDPIGKSPNLLYIAVFYKRIFFFDELLKRGINIDKRNIKNILDVAREPIIFEIMKTQEYHFLDSILNKKIDVEIYNNNHDTVINNFIRTYKGSITKEQKLDVLHRFVNLGANINERGQNGLQPIHCIARIKSNYFFDEIFDKNLNIDLNSRDMHGNTALIYAVKFDNFTGAKKLIENGAAVNIYNSKNQSAFFLSIITGNEKIFNLLLKNNVVISTIDKNKCNILHHIIEHEFQKNTKEKIQKNNKLFKYCQKIIDKHPELLFAKNNNNESPINLMEKNKTNTYMTNFFNQAVKNIKLSKNNDGNNI